LQNPKTPLTPKASLNALAKVTKLDRGPRRYIFKNLFLDLKYGIKRTTKTFLCLPQPHVKDFHSQSSDFEILKNPLGNVHFNTYYKGLHVLDGYHYALKISKRTYG